MLVLPSSKNEHFSLHFLPALPQFLRFERPQQQQTSITWPSQIITMTPPSKSPRCSRESSYDSQASTPSQVSAAQSPAQTIHTRRTISRTTSSTHTPPPPALHGFSDFFHSRVAAPISIPAPKESDAECWGRMLALQREYHCYNSARLEAAVEALESGLAIEEVPMRMFHFLSVTHDTLKLNLTRFSFEIVSRSVE